MQRKLSRRTLRKIFYWGKRYHCPICESQLRTFWPAGNPVRENVRCPVCRSLERHRFFWMYLSEHVPQITDGRHKRIVHFAPEYGLQPRYRQLPNVEYVAADLNSPRADMWLDVVDNPLADESVDIFICLHVLEHVVEDRQAMQEFYRALRPGGILFVMVPLRQGDTYENPDAQTPEERLKHFGQRDHVRYYGMDIRDRLEAAGFEVQLVTPDTYFNSQQKARYRLVDGSHIFVCKKPTK